VDNTQESTTKITVEDRPANKEEKNNTKVTEFVAMEKTKSWPSEDTNGKTIIGAEYDGTVYNNSGKSIVNWSMTIYMPIGKDGRPVEGTIDSSWNGDYTNNGDSITFLPADYLERIPKDENKTFGYVLYAPNGLDFTDFEIRGFYETYLFEYPEFWISAGGLVIWLIWLLAWLFNNFRTRKLRRQKEHDEKIIEETMQVFAGFIDAKDEYTKGHSTRVSFYSQKIAKRMGFSDEEIKMVGYMGLMHDCGKLAIPENILNKPGKLSEEEFDIMRRHTTNGGNILKDFTAIEGIRDGALYHHERYDGKGYMQGLAGEDIPLVARIIGVADALDAMNSDRCYRKHLPKEEILSELETHMGKQFDPKIARITIDMIKSGEIFIE
jgi:hypothetical protein